VQIRTAAGIAALTLAGTVFGVPASAAAPGRCALGTWRLTEAVLNADSPTARLRFTGGAGALLTLDGRTAVHSYGSSRRLAETGTSDGRTVSGWLQYRKTLRLKTTVTAGRLEGRPSSASGPATLKIRQTRPLNYDPSPQRVAALLKSGEFSGVPYRASYSCTSRTLRLQQKIKDPGRTLTGTWTYRRA
jgi:hypothetical protein